MGLGQGDRIATALTGSPETAVAVLAIASGFTCAPLNPSYRESEFDFYLSNLNAKALIVPPGPESPALAAARRRAIPILTLVPATDREAGIFGLESIERPAPATPRFGGPEDIALLLYTSGTTSRPKRVPLTHRNLIASAHYLSTALGLIPSDRCLDVMPLHHIHGIAAILASLAARASVAFTGEFSTTGFFSSLKELQPTWYTAVPTMHHAIVTVARDQLERIPQSPLRFIRSSSAPLPPQLMGQLEDVFNVPVVEAYGMTEAAHQIASNRLPPLTRKPGSVGLAIGLELVVLDASGATLPAATIGEVAIRGANVIRGYEAEPEANQAAFKDGWLRTGDQGYLDADGYLFLTGRLKEIINRGGAKIAPREVEEALLSHPAVAEAVVFGTPHPRLGEDVAAAVVLRRGAATSEGDIRAFASSRVATYKVPSRVVFVDRIPTGSSGKSQRVGLHERLAPLLATGFVAPRTPVEETLARLWAEALTLERVGITASFLQLGGDSLVATRLLARVLDIFRVDVPLRVLLEASTIAEMAEIIVQEQTAQSSPAEAISPRDSAEPCPLSFAQLRLWFLAQMEPNSPHYNEANALRFRGRLQVTVLQQALTDLVARHASLRTTIVPNQGQPLQAIGPAAAVSLPLLDLHGRAADEREAELQRHMIEIIHRPFDLTKDPLLRAVLIRLGESDHILLVVVHHIASDGWSMSILSRDICALYRARSTAGASPPPPLPIQYADYALWQRRRLQGKTLELLLAYWKRQLDGAPASLELLTDRPRKPVQTYRGARRGFSLPAPLSDALRSLSRQEHVTLFMTLLAAFQALLHRHTGQADILVGSPIAERTRRETEGLIGVLANMLVLRADLGGNPSFRAFMQRVRDVALEAYAHQELPFERLVEELRVQRSLSRPPLFQVVFVFQNVPQSTLDLPDLSITAIELDSEIAKFDLTLSMREDGSVLRGHIEYNSDLFDRATIDRMVGRFETMLESIVADPDRRVGDLLLLPPSEQALLASWNNTPAIAPRVHCLHRWFETQVQRYPDAVAVVCEGERLTYRELNSRANRVAHHLQSLGVGPDTLVALCVERSLDMAVGIMGILKSGGAYVPLDPAYPKERLGFILQDTEAPVLLTQASLMPRLPGYSGTIVRLDADHHVLAERSAANPTGPSTPDNAAYVIYTSGSTGTPKGVLVTHRNVARLFKATEEWFRFERQDVWTLFHSYAFDFSVWEYWGALLYGGRLVVVPFDVTRSPAAFCELLRTEGITVLNQTPSAFRQLAQSESQPGEDAPKLALRLVIFGGEALDVQGLQPWFARHGDTQPQLVNMFGITETTVHVTYRPLALADLRAMHGSPIGVPLPDLHVHVLDVHGQTAPIGVPGELYVGGAGVARGYHQRPELTRERFVPDEFCPDSGGRLYRSGDRVRFLADGSLEHLGRLDQQVKLRGFRVELGEVEATLRAHADVRDVVVTVRNRDTADARLVAYIVPARRPAPSHSAWSGFLKDKIPDYMIPAAFIHIQDVPLTPNGKVNYQALPDPDQSRPNLREAFVAPQQPIERRVAEILSTALGIERVGLHDDFFELGGHSLMLFQVIFRLHDTFSVQLSVRDFFDHPSVAGLARVVEERLILQAAPQEIVQALGSLDLLSADEIRALLSDEADKS